MTLFSLSPEIVFNSVAEFISKEFPKLGSDKNKINQTWFEKWIWKRLEDALTYFDKKFSNPILFDKIYKKIAQLTFENKRYIHF
jgi:hypothetical protein